MTEFETRVRAMRDRGEIFRPTRRFSLPAPPAAWI